MTTIRQPIPACRPVRTGAWAWAFIATWAALLLAATVATAQDGAAWLGVMGGKAWTPAKLGPVAWYQAEGNALDASGGGNDATWTGEADYDTGIVGSAFVLAETNYMARASHTLASFTNFTVCLWVKSTTANFDYLLGSFVETTGNRSWTVTCSSVGIYMAISTNGSSGVTSATIPKASVLDGAWHHVAFVRDGGIVRSYRDSVPVSTTDTGPNPVWTPATAPFLVGGASTRGWTGLMDDAMVFSRALSANEVARLYSESVKQSAKGTPWP